MKAAAMFLPSWMAPLSRRLESMRQRPHKTAGLALGFVLMAVQWTGYAQETTDLERGKYLTAAGGCVTCHTERKGVDFAGGRVLETEFGNFYSPNITPDPDTGIGSWTDEQFLMAFWKGIAPDGSHYFPAFPYTSYTGLSERDLLDIKAYLFSLEPVSKANRDHELPWFLSNRLVMAVWKLFFFDSQRFSADAEQSAEWNRGAYLVRHLGHCGECHTPRGRFGQRLADREMAGTPDGPDGDSVPNITPDKEDGIGRWSENDITFFLEIGMTPASDFAGSSMTSVIEENTGLLTGEDRTAIATYLMGLEPVASPAKTEVSDP